MLHEATTHERRNVGDDLLACIKEPDTDLGREWTEWLGPDYEPAACDLEKINRALRKLGK
jgi:hypothetical protein